MIVRRSVLAVALAMLFAGVPSGADESLPAVAAPYDEDWLFEEDLGPDPSERDPWETVNRPIFGFNDTVYIWVLDPIADFYETVVPDPVRTSVRNFFTNLHEPVILTNELLQGAGGDAMRTVGRFTINSTIGLAGLFSPADAFGLEHHDTDFGETLAVYGVPAGPYVVLPLVGPSSGRDAVGEGVDLLLRPDTWLLTAAPVFVVNAGDGFSSYDMERRRLEALRETSVDFYSAMRGAYLLDRDARVESRIQELGCESPMD
jgi:phospholipid-binding lipoprotein MlaA